MSSKRKLRSASKTLQNTPKQKRKTHREKVTPKFLPEEEGDGVDIHHAEPGAVVRQRAAAAKMFESKLDVLFSKHQQALGQRPDWLLQHLCRNAMAVRVADALLISYVC